MPTTPTYPGVYIEEIPSGVRTITGVATSIAAFVDYFERGLMNRAVQLFNMGDFQREFGGLNSQSEASYAIQQFFLNGGTEAWVVRVASDDKTTIPNEPAAARVEIDDTIPATAAEFTVKAISAGEWGNRLRVRVDNTADDGRFNLTVSDYSAVNGRNVLVGQEIFRNLSMNPGDKIFVDIVVNDQNTGSKLVRVKANGTPTQPAHAPLANGTLSDVHGADPMVPASPKVRVTIGGDRATVPLRFSENVRLPGSVPLTTIAPVLQSALRGSLPAESAFAGATVEVVGKRLHVLAGSDNPDDLVMFANIASSKLAENLKLTTGTPGNATTRKATLSGEHDPTNAPVIQIPAASPLNVKIGTSNAVTTALDLSNVQGATLPGRVQLQIIKQKLQDAIVNAGQSFHGAEVYVIDKSLLVLSPGTATDPVDFANTADIQTATELRLTGTDVSTRRATLSGGHGGTTVQINDPDIDVRIGGGSAQTLTMNLTPGPAVQLQNIASELERVINNVTGVTGAMVRVLEDRLLVLSQPNASNPIEFATTTTQTATELRLTGTDVSTRRATLSGEHSNPAGPNIPAALPVIVKIGTGTASTATAVLKFSNTTLPKKVDLATVQGSLQTAIREADTTSDAFSKAIVAIVRGNRLLVLPGQNGASTADFTNAGASTTADDLRLTGAPRLNVVLSGDHPSPTGPEIPPDPELDVTIGNSIATAAPDFSDLGQLPLNVTLENIAPRLQAAISRAEPDDPAFRDATVDVVEKMLLVVPGGTTANLQVAFAKPSQNTTADALRLSSTATANVQEYKLGGATKIAARLGGEEGTNGVPPNRDALLSGIDALEGVDLFNLLCIPRVAELPAEEAKTVISVAQTYCERRRAFLLIDTPKGIDEPQEVKNWVAANIPRHRNSAFFYPRVKISDPLDDSRLRSVGASGTLAGLFARTDSTRGVWKAPAGTAATLVNVSQLDDVLTDEENGTLNPLAINCLRNFPIYGNVAWGARTLDGSDQQASEWKYIPVRRLALFLEESLYRGIKWVVFEPNDEPLWSQIRLNVGAFMQNLFRQGAFQGQTPREAYFVKCDGETTTQNDINLGIVNILVGFAPLKPAEFVILKIQQMAGQIET